MTIYRKRAFWEGVLDRMLRTLGQSIAAGAVATIFTGAGALAFLVVVGVAMIGCLGTCLASPEKVLLGAVPDVTEPTTEGTITDA